jgi:hypothetical protein
MFGPSKSNDKPNHGIQEAGPHRRGADEVNAKQGWNCQEEHQKKDGEAAYPPLQTTQQPQSKPIHGLFLLRD